MTLGCLMQRPHRVAVTNSQSFNDDGTGAQTCAADPMSQLLGGLDTVCYKKIQIVQIIDY